MGLETPAPRTDAAAAAANFTNEGGAYGTFRFLKNVMGMWLLERCRAHWESEGTPLAYGELIEFAQAELAGDSGKLEMWADNTPLLYPDAPELLNPENMPNALAKQLTATGQQVPESNAALGACILTSLALRYAEILDRAAALQAKAPDRSSNANASFVDASEGIRGLQIVGGGSQNAYLNQLTADLTGLPVRGGPVEATAYGNLMVQAVTAGRLRRHRGGPWIYSHPCADDGIRPFERPYTPSGVRPSARPLPGARRFPDDLNVGAVGSGWQGPFGFRRC